MAASARKLALIAFTAAAALAASGCDLNDNPDLQQGEQAFVESCGACHVLAAAGTQGTTGPNLDAAFAQSRRDGLGESTFEGVVQRQILYPQGEMPANLVEGENVENVSAYVASVAGVAGAKPRRPPGGEDDPGAQIFTAQGCGSCHTLEAAGTSGTAGPDLDKTLEGKDADYVRRGIVEPDAEIVEGFSAGVMPSDYGDKLSNKELRQLVDFILKSVGGDS